MENSFGYMLEEYKQMFSIYKDLLDQNNKMLTLYVTIIGIGASIIIGLSDIELKGGVKIDLSSLPIEVGILSILLSLIGLIIFFSIVGLRFEMILYIRAINELRGYFVDTDEKKDIKNNKIHISNNKIHIKKYLVLPHSDEKIFVPDKKIPPYHESYTSWFFGVVILMAFINGALLTMGIFLFREIKSIENILFLLIFWSGIHYLIYFQMASKKEKQYKKQREENQKEHKNKNIDVIPHT